MKNIKVYQINLFYGIGSTGKLVKDLYEYCNRYNIDMRMAARNSNRPYAEYYCASNKISRYFHSIMSRLTGLQGYYSINTTKKMIEDIQEFEPDIIHLHNLHGHYVNLNILFNFLKKYNKPIVWTLHDCWAFTGTCSYYSLENCMKWKNCCNNCPNIKKYPESWFFDFSKKCYLDKKKLYSKGLNLHIITVSKWLMNEVKFSFLKNYQIDTIYNYIDLNIFKILKSNHKEGDDINILSLASSWSSTKGIYELIDFATYLPSNMKLTIVGKMKYSLKRKCIKNNITVIGNVTNINELVNYYNMSNILLSLSKEETFGMTVAEAAACGVPAITLKCTGIQEIVHKKYGVCINEYNPYIILNEINRIMSYDQKKLKKTLREYAENKFNKSIQCEAYLQLYQKIALENK